MTAFAFIIGLLPLLFASGAYSVARNIMGLSLVGGMIVATLLGIFVYPSLYYMVGRVARFEKRRERKQKQRIEYEKESTL
jgi:HAE1 family hydrophobic/amphiphilic exporter-1